MEKHHVIRARTVSFFILGTIFAAGTVVLTAALWFLRDQISITEVSRSWAAARLALMLVCLIGLNLVLLGWTTIRYIRFRRKSSQETKPTPYVDAWAEAGQRFQVPDADENGD